MIIIPKLSDGFPFERMTYDEFINEHLPVDGCVMHDMGESSWVGKNVYAVSYGDLENKSVIYLQGALHGSEWSPPHYLVEFMKMIVNPPENACKPIIERLKTKFSFFLIPILNPYGYEYDSRYNANGVDINRNFPPGWEEFEETNPGMTGNKGTAPFSEKETQIVRDVVLQYRPVGYFDMHTHGLKKGNVKINGPEGFATYHYKEIMKDMMVSMRFLGASNPFFQELYFAPLRPTGPAWIATTTSSMGIKPFTGNPEVGEGADIFETDLEGTVEHSRLGTNLLLLWCIYVEQYLEKKQVIINNSDIY